MPRFRKKMKEPSRPELLRLTEKELATYPYPWDAFRHLSEDELELEAQWIANNPEAQRLIAEAQLREKRRAEEKEDQAQLKKRRARSAARAARTRKRRAK
jgi:hypothetical protein